MKILHIQFAGPYTSGMNYQENLLPKEHVRLGHAVTLLTCCYAWMNGTIQYVPEESCILPDGVHLRRIDFRRLGTEFFTRKMRWVKGLDKVLQEETPDFIMLHDFQSVSTLAVCRFIKKHPAVHLVVDCHTDFYNSARNWLSKYILHGVIYKRFAQEAGKRANKLYYLSEETKDFMLERYHLPKEKLEYLPLGGILFSDEEYEQKRSRRRKELGIKDENILVVHSGKMSKEKRTVELMKAFTATAAHHMFLAIIGTAEPDVQNEIETACKNNQHITYLGWKRGEDLLDYLCAADVYAQPGTQSATLQNAICARCAIMVYPYSSHRTMMQGNGYYIENERQIQDALADVACHPEKLEQMKLNSLKVGKELLDYKRQAEKIIEVCEDV